LTILGAALAANALLQVDFSSAQQILHPFVGSWLGILAVALLGPIVEEVIFRCIAIVWLSSFCRGWVAVLLAAIPFAFVHASSAEHMLFAFAAGVTLGATYQLSGSIVPGLLAHVCINSIALSQVMGHTA
jgi:membrane protease YdiL (CAAX protease family)